MAELLGCTDKLESVLDIYDEGCKSERAELFIWILNNSIKDDTPDEVRSRLLSCEYSVWMFIVFVDHFLNSKCIIKLNNEGKRIQGEWTVRNLQDEVATIKRGLEYFETWKTKAKGLKKNGKDESWKKTFISEQTYKNMRITTRGFLGYAEAMLNAENPPDYVPYAHANQSSIENIFSQLRGMQRMSPAKFSKGLLAIRMKKQLDTYQQHCFLDE